MPLFHVGGSSYIQGGIHDGMTSIMTREADGASLVGALMAGATRAFLVPAVLSKVMEMGPDAIKLFGQLRTFAYGAAPRVNAAGPSHEYGWCAAGLRCRPRRRREWVGMLCAAMGSVPRRASHVNSRRGQTGIKAEGRHGLAPIPPPAPASAQCQDAHSLIPKLAPA
jgi:hypothetical protein